MGVLTPGQFYTKALHGGMGSGSVLRVLPLSPAGQMKKPAQGPFRGSIEQWGGVVIDLLVWSENPHEHKLQFEMKNGH